MAFLPPPSIRQTISVPTQDKIDFRAACFCHKNIVDVGFVCSVCLSSSCLFFSFLSSTQPNHHIFHIRSLLSACPSLFNMSVSTSFIYNGRSLTIFNFAEQSFPSSHSNVSMPSGHLSHCPHRNLAIPQRRQRHRKQMDGVFHQFNPLWVPVACLIQEVLVSQPTGHHHSDKVHCRYPVLLLRISTICNELLFQLIRLLFWD